MGWFWLTKPSSFSRMRREKIRWKETLVDQNKCSLEKKKGRGHVWKQRKMKDLFSTWKSRILWNVMSIHFLGRNGFSAIEHLNILFCTISALCKAATQSESAANAVGLSSGCERENHFLWVIVQFSNSFEDWNSVYRFLLLHSEEALRVTGWIQIILTMNFFSSLPFLLSKCWTLKILD